MTDQPYDKPPITEAVIELRFGEPLGVRELENVNRSISKTAYPKEDRVANLDVRVNMLAGPAGAPKPVASASSVDGFKRSSNDATEVLVLWPQSFVVAQLTPYPGWDKFLSRFQSEWAHFKGRTPFRSVTRIGVRYINRLDLPVDDGQLQEDHYLNLHIGVPPLLGPFLEAAAQSKYTAADLDAQITLNWASIPSPLPLHISMLLDIDIYRERNVPQKDEDIVALLQRIRCRKNDIFEASITDRTRRLFRA